LELNKKKEELMQQKDDLEKSNARTKKLREELEAFKKTQQQNNEKCISILRGHLLQHVKDISLWRTLLEADRQFTEDGVKFVNPDEIKGLGLSEQLAELDKAVKNDNKRLEKLVREKESEAAEVVSVNIGKKKKRIKKSDPLDALHEAGNAGQEKEKEKDKEKEKERKEKREKVEKVEKVEEPAAVEVKSPGKREKGGEKASEREKEREKEKEKEKDRGDKDKDKKKAKK